VIFAAIQADGLIEGPQLAINARAARSISP